MITGQRHVLLLAFSQAIMVIGTVIASMPAALLMRRFGRRTGFLTGASLGLIASLMCALALQQRSSSLLITGLLLLGS